MRFIYVIYKYIENYKEHSTYVYNARINILYILNSTIITQCVFIHIAMLYAPPRLTQFDERGSFTSKERT